jgi:hypothetical protein
VGTVQGLDTDSGMLVVLFADGLELALPEDVRPIGRKAAA